MECPMSRCNCSSLRKASRRLSHLYDGWLAQSGLKATQYAILSEINRRESEGPTLRELAEALAMDASTLGQNLRPLERDSLVSIETSQADRRRRNVRLTRQGREAFARAEPLWAQAQAWFEQRFGTEEAAALRALLSKILDDTSLPNAVA